VEQAWDLAILARKALDTIDELRGQLENERWRDAAVEKPPASSYAPVFSVRVLIIDATHDYACVETASLHLQDGYWMGECARVSNVTHWLPMPKPPMKERVP